MVKGAEAARQAEQAGREAERGGTRSLESLIDGSTRSNSDRLRATRGSTRINSDQLRATRRIDSSERLGSTQYSGSLSDLTRFGDSLSTPRTRARTHTHARTHARAHTHTSGRSLPPPRLRCPLDNPAAGSPGRHLPASVAPGIALCRVGPSRSESILRVDPSRSFRSIRVSPSGRSESLFQVHPSRSFLSI